MTQETSLAVQLIIQRLGLLAGDADPQSAKANPKAILLNVPVEQRAKAITVLKTLGQRDAEDLAQGARLVLNAATALWKETEVSAEIARKDTVEVETMELEAA